ncbi:MAG TPA: TetR/AcrR family transcriptional regulator [Spirochaetia bacterium]|jgi:AcrR family transcriptional regulator|nr:TetR/AcrR family transcriptional regulator [Spirochaetia bacterium]
MDQGDERRGRGKPRDAQLRREIVTAAAEVLLERGYTGFTIEGVAARAGASKVTIYKWWASKGTLALDGYVEGITEAIAFPQTDSPRQDIELQLTAVIQRLTTTASGRAMVELIGAAQEDADLKRELSARYIQPRRDLAARAFGRLLGWDPLARKEELNAITDQVYGAVYNRLLFGLEPLDAGFASRLVAFWAPLPDARASSVVVPVLP